MAQNKFDIYVYAHWKGMNEPELKVLLPFIHRCCNWAREPFKSSPILNYFKNLSDNKLLFS